MTELLHFHFYALEKEMATHSRDGGAWWAAIYGVVQSQTRLKRLSSSSSRGYPVFSTPYIKEIIISPLCILGTLLEDQLSVNAEIMRVK